MRKNEFNNSIREISRISKPFMVITALQSALSLVFPFLEVLLQKKIINELISAFQTHKFDVVVWVVVLVTVELVQKVGQEIYNKFYYNVAYNKIKNQIKKNFIQLMSDIDYVNFECKDFCDNLSFVIGKIDTLFLESWQIVLAFSISVLSVFGWISYFVFIDPFLLVFVVINLLAKQFISYLNAHINYSYQEKIAPINRYINYIFSIFSGKNYQKEIKSSTALVDLFQNKYSKHSDELITCLQSYNKSIFKNQFVQYCINFVYSLLIMSYIAVRIIQGILTPGDFTSVQAAIGYVYDGISSVLSIPIRVNEQKLYLKKYYSLFDSSSTIERAKNEGPIPDFKSVTFDSVSFTYPFASEKAIKNITFTIHKGQRIAIVGENGAGKTTLLKLLLRLYDPQEGTVLYNDIPYDNFAAKSVRKHFAEVFQDYILFKMSFLENIAEGETVSDDEKDKIKRGLAFLNMDTRINLDEDMENSFYGKEFSTFGTDLSGGEIQKLLIAKAFYQDRDIVLFDEPSSALDPLLEQKLVNLVSNLAEGKTSVIITHRLAFARKADVIYYIENGEIVEIGTHSQLVNKKGKYAAMYNAQIGSLLDE